MSSSSTKAYKFQIVNGVVTAVYEIENGQLKNDGMDHDESWSLNGGNVIKTKWDDGQLKTTAYTDSDGDGIYFSTPTTTDGSINHSVESDGVEHPAADATHPDLQDTLTHPNDMQGSGNDLSGNNNNDNLQDSKGNDHLNGGNGTNVLDGGVGNDNHSGGNNNDNLQDSKGNDHLAGGAGNDNLSGGNGNDDLQGSEGNDHVAGGAGNDHLNGENGNDTVVGGAGDDTVDGGAGTDMMNFNGNSRDFTLHQTATGLTVISLSEGTDTLSNIERLQFSDATIALDIAGNAGQAYRIYQAAFNRTPDNDGLKYWIGRMDGGTTQDRVAAEFVDSQEFQNLYGTNPSNADFLTKLYSNVLHRTPDSDGYDWWLGQLDGGAYDKTSALASFAESNENQAGVIGVIQNGIDLFL